MFRHLGHIFIAIVITACTSSGGRGKTGSSSSGTSRVSPTPTATPTTAPTYTPTPTPTPTGTPPGAPVITDPATTSVINNDSTLNVSGTCDTGNTITLGGVAASDVTSPANTLIQTCTASAFAYVISKTTDATYNITVTQTSAGGVSPEDNVAWLRDTFVPDRVQITSPILNPQTSGGDNMLIYGSCESDASVVITGDDSQSTTCVGSSFSLTINKTVDGTYNFSLYQVDLATNQSLTTDFVWIRDNSYPPVPTINTPGQNPYYSNNSALTIAGDCVTTNTITLSGDVVAGDVSSPMGSLSQACVASAYSFTIQKPSDSIYSIIVSQSNGVTSSHSSMIWHKDSVAPSSPSLLSPSANPFISGDSTFVVMGTCESQSVVTMSGDAAGTVSCSGSNTFSFTINQAIDGTYDYSFSQTDRAGNISVNKDFSWERDTTIPTSPTIALPATAESWSNDADIVVSGSCISDYLVTLGGDVVDTDVTTPANSLTQTCVDSAYSFTIAKATEGYFDFTVIQTSASEIDSAQASVRWYRDTTNPSALVITQPLTDPYTSAGVLTLSGSGCESLSIVSLAGDDSQSVLCDNGFFSFTITESIDGTYNYDVIQTDQAGNASPVTSQQWIRDSAVPATPTIIVPASNPYISSTSSITISGGCVAGYTVTLGGEVIAGDVSTPPASLTQLCTVDNTYLFVVDKVADDTYDFTVVQDGGGPISGAATRSWLKDGIAPVMTITSNPSDPNLSLTSTFTFTADGPVTRMECSINGGAYSICTSPVSYTVANGASSFAVRAVDSAGNVGAPDTYNWTQEAYNTVALYHFDSGSVLDDSSSFGGGEANDLTDTTTTVATGKFSTNGRRFTSSSSQFMSSVDNNSQDVLRNRMSLETFVSFATLPSINNYMTFISKAGGAGNLGWEFGLRRQGSKYYLYFKGSLNGTSSSEVKSSNCTVSAGTFYHFAMTWDRGSIRFYCNGSAKGSATIGTAGQASLYNTTAALKLGSANSTYYLNGTLDEVRISQNIRWTATFTPPASAYVAD